MSFDFGNFSELQSTAGLLALAEVVLIDLLLAGDNAVVIGMAAAGLPPAQRSRAILIGIAAATVMRIAFALIAVQLLGIVGLVLVGGLLLLWVAWKMWRELRDGKVEQDDPSEEHGEDFDHDGERKRRPEKSLGQAALQIVVADISMSLDNVLAVAGAAREHPMVLAIGLILSVALMGVAASIVARMLERYRWLVYAGLLLVVYVALDMIWRGGHELWPNLPF